MFYEKDKQFARAIYFTGIKTLNNNSYVLVLFGPIITQNKNLSVHLFECVSVCKVLTCTKQALT